MDRRGVATNELTGGNWLCELTAQRVGLRGGFGRRAEKTKERERLTSAGYCFFPILVSRFQPKPVRSSWFLDCERGMWQPLL